MNITAPVAPPKFLSAEEDRQWKWTNEVLPHLRAAGYPLEYRRRIQLSPEQQAVFDKCTSLLVRTGAIVALIGPRGTGKTTIASQIAMDRAWNESLLPWHRRPPYRKLTTMIARFKAIYADFGSTDTERLLEYREDFCADHPLVVFDELHECDDQKMKDRVLTDLVDRRYSNRNDTLLISNQTFDDFIKTTSDSILSRLEQHGKILVCDWKSFRTPK